MNVMEQLERLVKAGKDMRAAQKAYFKSRDYGSLRYAKDFEKRFDDALEEIEGAKNTQGRLL